MVTFREVKGITTITWLQIAEVMGITTITWLQITEVMGSSKMSLIAKFIAFHNKFTKFKHSNKFTEVITFNNLIC
jgi:hypothetical protein